MSLIWSPHVSGNRFLWPEHVGVRQRNIGRPCKCGCKFLCYDSAATPNAPKQSVASRVDFLFGSHSFHTWTSGAHWIDPLAGFDIDDIVTPRVDGFLEDLLERSFPNGISGLAYVILQIHVLQNGDFRLGHALMLLG